MKPPVKSAKYPPFNENEIQSLIKKFKTLDENSRGSLTLDEFKNLLEIRMHFFRDRIYTVLDTFMKREGFVTMNFDLFIKFLTVFHPLTSMDDKYKYMFSIYDLDGDGSIS